MLWILFLFTGFGSSLSRLLLQPLTAVALAVTKATAEMAIALKAIAISKFPLSLA